MARIRIGATACAASVVLAASLWLASPADATVLTSAVATMADGSYGSTVAGALTITNSSTAPESATPITYSFIDLYPACNSSGPPGNDCANGSLEPDVYQLQGAVTGTSTPAGNSTCAGTWTATQGSPGRWRLVPPGGEGTLQLNAGQSCAANFTARILRLPTDVEPGIAGAQTFTASGVLASHAGTSLPRMGNHDEPTVTRASPGLSTSATSSVQIGSPIQDVATVTGVAAPASAPTGSVTFQLYGPDDATCSGAATTVSSNPLGGGPPPTATSSAYAPAHSGTYRWRATYGGDANYLPVSAPCNSSGETSTVISTSGRYNPLTPARILDTRDGTGGITGPLAPSSAVNVQITGRGGVPTAGVLAVALNVTVTQPTAPGYLTLYPAGVPGPLAANLTFRAGQTVPNLAVAKLGAGGRVSLYNSAGNTHVIFDVAGWYSDVPVGSDGRFVPVTPARILDTRNGTGGGVRLGPGASLDMQVSGQGGVPATGVEGAVLNVAATNTTATSFITAYPTGEARPLAANLNFNGGETVSNRVMAKLGAGGKVTIYNALGSTDVVVDVSAWFTDSTVAGTSGVFTPLTPARILDTRIGTGGISGPLAANTTVNVQVTGQGGVPASGVNAVVVNATVVGTVVPGFLTLFPAGSPKPFVSDLNFAAGETRPNLGMPRVGTGGKVALYTSATGNVVFDVAGWYS